MKNPEATNKFLKWRKSPKTFFTEVLGITTLEPYQVELLSDVANNDKIAVRACHSVGKTWTMARLALWFYSVYPNSIIITTAPTHKQVESLLWGEIREAYKKSKYNLGGNLLTTKLMKSDKHYAMGFSPQKTAGSSDEQRGSSFQGFHSDNIFVIFDEATGVDLDVWKMSEGLLTSGKVVKFVAIGNPTTRDCEFFRTFSSPRFKKVHLSCFNSPNLRANGLTNIHKIKRERDRLMALSQDDCLKELKEYANPSPHLLSASWVMDYVLEWGIDHPLVISKAFGNFPEDDEFTLMSLKSVEDCQALDLNLDMSELRCIGVDVARYGDDRSVLVEMVGKKQTGLKVTVKQSITEVSGLVVNMINGEMSATKTVVLIDATGLGAGVYDSLVESQASGVIPKSVELIEIHFGSSPENKNERDKKKVEQDKSRYFNLKARMFQLLADDIKSGVDLFDDSNFLKELPTIKNLLDSKGRLRIESKDEYRKRTGLKSPDFSDALALCNFGRYVNVGFGSFSGRADQKPLVKQDKPKPRRSGIRTREY